MQTIAILLIVVVAPIWLALHYTTKWKEMKGISPEDEASFADLRTAAEKLEERLETLERILDDEIPDWRERYHEEA